MGYILLEGGAEFGGMMAEPDRRAIALAGGPDARISIIPAAAAPDNNHRRSGQNGVRWFQHLGATDVTALTLIDRSSANNPDIAEALRKSRLIYLLGGFTHHLGQTLSGSTGWQAVLTAYETGSVIAGSSAGAMVLCEHYYHHRAGEVKKGLNLIGGACVLSHHNTFGESWAPELRRILPEAILIGIDEETGMLNDGPRNRWQVYGKGAVTLYRGNQTVCYSPGEAFSLKP